MQKVTFVVRIVLEANHTEGKDKLQADEWALRALYTRSPDFSGSVWAVLPLAMLTVGPLAVYLMNSLAVSCTAMPCISPPSLTWPHCFFGCDLHPQPRKHIFY